MSHSFWPDLKPSAANLVKDVLHLMHLGSGSKGVEPEFAHHYSDMEREELGQLLVIQHQVPDLDKLQIEKEANLALAAEASELESNLEIKTNLLVEIEQLEQEESLLKE
ncbi:hypothetical protein [Legionella tunisiensis]|uniref:hypothetical protein n=1 Tax=Legionella tunisiensis TaxID=1034944 RepID=UPI00047519BF|nr:hypothetical protein [Legionella tunisiensis]